MRKTETVWRLLARRPYAALAAVLLVLIQAVLNVSEVVILERFIDGFSDFQWVKSVLFAAVLSMVYAFYYFQTPLTEYLKDKIRLQLRVHLEGAVIEKTARICVEALEDTENQALLGRLREEPERRYADGFFAVLRLMGGAVGTLGILTLILKNVPFFFFVILLLLGLMAVVFRLIAKTRVEAYRTRQEIARRSDYLSGILFDRRLAQEKKLFGYTPYIQKLYEEETISSGRKMARSVFFSNMVLWVYDNITFLFSASAYLFFLFPLYRGEMELGLYISMIPALARLGAFFVAVGGEHWPTYQEYRACLTDLEALTALPEQYYDREEEEGEPPSFHVLKGEKVVFRYPGQEKPVLDGLDFAFYAGKNYALAGENGCGKSTLVKLLMGFYRPESGVITIDGTDIQKIGFAGLQRYFSAVFQDFNRYDYTIKENISISGPGTRGREEMYRAAGEAGLNEWISSCPDGYDTKLGNLEEGGMDLSGGQWQRLSIARMLFRRAPFRIWDEPTAAMDPLAESRLYGDFLQKGPGACANLFVTHRLGAAVHADEICVLENGRFVEQGSHAQLMEKKDGLYHRMFEAQKGLYQ